MPVKKSKTASKLNRKTPRNRKPARRTIKAAAKKSARKATKRVAIQPRKEPVAPPEPSVEVFEVVETEIYERPVLLANDDEVISDEEAS